MEGREGGLGGKWVIGWDGGGGRWEGCVVSKVGTLGNKGMNLSYSSVDKCCKTYSEKCSESVWIRSPKFRGYAYCLNISEIL